MSESSSIDVVSLIGIEFVDGGRSVRLEIVDTIPPHEASFLTFRNAFAVRLYQTRDDGFPFTLCEISWREVGSAERADILGDLAYPFFASNGLSLLLDQRLVLAHLEGAMVGDILAEEVIHAAS